MNTQIDITELIKRPSFDPYQLCNSVANLGDDAGKVTYANAKQLATTEPKMLESEDEKEAFRDFVRDSGGWDDEEIAAWDESELIALFLQWVAGDIREAFGDDLSEDFNEWDWAQYEEDAEKGRVASRLFRSDGKLYFDISN